MDYPVTTLNQLRFILQGFRKANKLTQTALAQKLGVSQQSYAQLEANPTSASIDRLCKVLRILDVDLVLRDGIYEEKIAGWETPKNLISIPDPHNQAIMPRASKVNKLD